MTRVKVQAFEKDGATGEVWIRDTASPDGGAYGAGGGGGGAPTSATYVTLTTNGTLTNERVLTAGAGVALTDAGAGGAITVSTTAPVFGGLISGGVLTINADTTKFDVSAGSAYIAGALVSWSASLAVVTTNLATSTVTHVFISAAGAVTQQTGAPTPTQRRAAQYLGQLGHTNLTSIASAVSDPDVWQSPDAQFRDFLRCVGIYSCGGNFASANGANLSIDISAGELFGSGVNFATDPTNPNIIALTGVTAPSIRRRTQTGNGASSTSIDPNSYDSAGTITAMPANRFQVQRIYRLTSGNIVVQYGQATYLSISAAFDGFASEGFVPFPNTSQIGALIGLLIVQDGTTDLTNTAKARFVAIAGLSGGSSGGADSGLTQSQVLARGLGS